MAAKTKFFKSQAVWHKWLEQHHADTEALWVGFYKIGSGKPSITYPEALDEALCFGWIDGIRKSVDAESYTIRFTPRKKRSRWSDVNAKRVQTLIQMSRMQPSGIEAFKSYNPEKTDQHAFERQNAKLTAEYEKQFKARPQAWIYFQSKSPSYRKLTAGWVMSAKKEETRLKRLATLIEDSDHERLIAPMARLMKSKYGVKWCQAIHLKYPLAGTIVFA
jgi:uncharacterized protein YdeI (YjbR/CyaY-like superfamily)